MKKGSKEPGERFLAATKVGPQFKMHLPKAVVDALELSPGDHIGFHKTATGDVVVVRL